MNDETMVITLPPALTARLYALAALLKRDPHELALYIMRGGIDAQEAMQSAEKTLRLLGLNDSDDLPPFPGVLPKPTIYG